MAQAQQHDKRQAAATGIGVGGSSILAVFVILCLTTFATLSLVSARADLRLSQRSAQSVTLYYQADSQAQQLLAELADHIKKAPAPQQFLEKAKTFDYITLVEPRPDSVLIRFSIPMDKSRSLEVETDMNYQGGFTHSYYRVAAAPQGDIVLEDGLPVWDGTIPG